RVVGPKQSAIRGRRIDQRAAVRDGEAYGPAAHWWIARRLPTRYDRWADRHPVVRAGYSWAGVDVQVVIIALRATSAAEQLAIAILAQRVRPVRHRRVCEDFCAVAGLQQAFEVATVALFLDLLAVEVRAQARVAKL